MNTGVVNQNLNFNQTSSNTNTTSSITGISINNKACTTNTTTSNNNSQTESMDLSFATENTTSNDNITKVTNGFSKIAEGFTDIGSGTLGLINTAGATLTETAANIGSEVKSVISDAKSIVVDKAKDIIDTAASVGNKVKSGVKDFFGNIISGLKGIGSTLKETCANIASNVSSIVSSISTWIEDNKENIKQSAKMVSSIVGAASIGSIVGGPVGAVAGGMIGAALNKDDILSTTSATVSKAATSIGNFFSSVKNKVGDVFNNVKEAVTNTAADIASKAKSAFDWIGDKLSSAGNAIWDAITHPVETLKKTAASIGNTVVGLVQGISEFGEAIVDTGAIAVTAVSSVFTGIYDLGQWIHGKITGDEDWSSATKSMWDGTMDFVSTKHVTNAFDSFHKNNAIGKWLDENAYDPFKSTGTIYQIADGIGYVTGVIALTLATFGAGGAAVTAGQTATIAATAGFGRGAETAWSNGASLGEGLAFAGLNAGWEGLQFYAGAKIGAPGGYGDQIANRLLSEGTSQLTRNLVGSGTRIALDSLDGGIEGFVQPLLQTIYADGYYDESGNYIEFTSEDTLMDRVTELFDDMGGWRNVAIQTAIGGGGSMLGEVGDLRKLLAPVDSKQPVNIPSQAAMAVESTALLGTSDAKLSLTSLIDNTTSKPDIDFATSTSLTDVGNKLEGLVQSKYGKSFFDLTDYGYDGNRLRYGKDIADGMEAYHKLSLAEINKNVTRKYIDDFLKDPTTPAPQGVSQEIVDYLTKYAKDPDITAPMGIPQEVIDYIANKNATDPTTIQVTDVDSAIDSTKKITEMTNEEIRESIQREIDGLDSSSPYYTEQVNLLKEKEKLELELRQKLDAYSTSTKAKSNFDLLSEEQQQKVVDVAETIYNKAIIEQPEVTSVMRGLEGSDAKLVGLKYRQKSLDSIIDKLARKTSSQSPTYFDSNLLFAQQELNDSLRYTLIIDPANYETSVMTRLAALQNMGYTIRTDMVNNAWGNSTYKGLNITLESPNHTLVELQFHTDASFKVKETLNHQFYEISRNSAYSDDIINISNQIQKINQKLYTEEIQFPYNQSNIIDGLQQYKGQFEIKIPETIKHTNVSIKNAFADQLDEYKATHGSTYEKIPGTDIPKELVIDDINGIKNYGGGDLTEGVKKISAQYGEKSIQAVTAKAAVMQEMLKTNKYNGSNNWVDISKHIQRFYEGIGLKSKDYTTILDDNGINIYEPFQCSDALSQIFSDDISTLEKLRIANQLYGVQKFTSNDSFTIAPKMRLMLDMSPDEAYAISQLSSQYETMFKGIEENTILYRGMKDLNWVAGGKLEGLSSQELVDALNGLSGTQVIKDNAIVSETPILGQGFTGWYNIIEVTSCPPGTQGAFLGEYAAYGKGEVEYNLQAGVGNRKVILGAEEIDGKVYVYTQIVPE